MENKRKKLLLVVLLLALAIGFAAVTTNLIMNGNIKVGSNTSDFDVYFSAASTDEGGTAVIDDVPKQHITFTSKVLKEIGETATLNYTVFNNSSQYDANVTVSFTATNTVDGKDYSSYYTITRTGFDTSAATVVPGKRGIDGAVIISLNKVVTEPVQIVFTLTLNVNAVERTTEATPNTPVVEDYDVITGDINTIGSVVKLGNEEFYVIGQEDSEHVKLLAKYNLNVGESTVEDATVGIQNEDADGRYSAIMEFFDYTAPGVEWEEPEVCGEFCDYGYWCERVDPEWPGRYTLKSHYAAYTYQGYDEYPVDVYDDNTPIKAYVDQYVSYLTGLGYAVTNGRLLTYGDAISLGCDEYDEGVDSTCPSNLNFLFTSSYWTGSAQYFNTEIVFLEYANGYNAEQLREAYGVRPVIILTK